MAKVKTYNEFKNEIETKFSNIKVLSKEYKNSKTKMKFWCYDGEHDFEGRPDTMLRGSSVHPCSKCSKEISDQKRRDTLTTFIQKVAKAMPEFKFDYSKTVYEKSDIEVTIGCAENKNHKTFSVSPREFLQKKSGCPKCSKERKRQNQLLSVDELLPRLEKIHGDSLKFDLSNYEGVAKNISVTCTFHNRTFHATPNNLLRGTGCKKCGDVVGARKRAATTEKWIIKAKSIHGDRFNYDYVDYKTAKEDVLVECLEHGLFKVRPTNHTRSPNHSGCKKCSPTNANKTKTNKAKPRISQKKFLMRAKEANPDCDYDYSLSVYEIATKKVEVFCRKHKSTFYITPNNLYAGHTGCSDCERDRIRLKRKKPIEEFINKSRAHYGDIYDYSLVSYNNMRDHVIVTCPIHGSWSVIANNHQQGKSGCPTCDKLAKSQRARYQNSLNTDIFIERAQKLHGNRYDYELTKYEGTEKPVVIVCRIHGEFSQTPHNHLNGKGCYDCGMDKRIANQRLPAFELINRMKLLHGDRYSYPDLTRDGADQSIDITCKIHGVFPQMIRTHLEGKGCPKCSLSKGENAIARLLDLNNIEYVVEYKIKDGASNQFLRYDFLLPKRKILIEFDGQHHFEPVKFGGMSGEKAKQVHNRIVDRDKRKNLWAKTSGMTLIRIKYDQLVDDILLDKGIIKKKFSDFKDL